VSSALTALSSSLTFQQVCCMVDCCCESVQQLF